MAYQERPAEEIVAQFKVALDKLEQDRAAVSGEAEIHPREIIYQNYDQIIRGALRLAFQAEHRLQRVAPKIEEGVVLALAGAIFMTANALESQARYSVTATHPKNRLLDRALKQLGKLERYLPSLDEINHTLHGPIIWQAEIARAKAITYERRPASRKPNLEQATNYYQKAIDIAERKITQTLFHPNQELLMEALSVGGVARVELAQINDLLLHDFGEEILRERLGISKSQKEGGIATMEGEKARMEEEIRKLFIDGRDLVWQTLEVPNYDRLETIEGRTFNYLKGHSKSEAELITDPEFLTTMEHLKKLSQQSQLVKERMKKRLAQGLIPPQFTPWFES
ncbi:MAG: hypothetical protein UU73_C0003G0017 [Candidatus Daviesbacteria bacterium GW2011_GWA1_41_61]|nr:MAG: hypothetical protein UU26_C0005G0038 [Candidatus Daviesbacteria bacterium GW2011_GWC1_40_9]KKR93631.1 MAG: hypothetical protein UU44_C0002G0292 [Candidatus Daviesbacteria bacterium GW2011_GWB1_41_15]KKS14818.1 MAG: hypothetical protein UU73_C0003G0017 [Candidatus Daviesbacteria bacterium GW2011_GWA1_41_61]